MVASLFPKVIDGGWDNEDNIREYLEHMALERGVKSPQDWLVLFPQQYREINSKIQYICRKHGGWYGMCCFFVLLY